MKTRLTFVPLALAAMALVALAVACGGGGPKVTVEKGLAAAAAAEQRVEGEAASESASLALPVGVEEGAPATVPDVLGTRAGMSGSWGLGGALAPSVQGVAAGLTVQGYGRATAAADSARVQFVVTQGYDYYYPEPLWDEPWPVPEEEVPGEIAPSSEPVSPPPVIEEDLEALIDAIKAEGVSEDDIEVTIYPSGGYYDPYSPVATARVTVTLRDVDKVGPVVEAGTTAVELLTVTSSQDASGTLFLQNVGVLYSVDDCSVLLREARRRAWEACGQVRPGRKPPAGGVQSELHGEAALEELVERASPRVVLHTAAMADPGACFRDPDAAQRINAEIPALLARVCDRLGVRLIHVSTDLVFDGEHPPYRESDRALPVSVYGRTKLRGEEHARNVESSLVVRTAWLYGHDGGNFVETIRSQINRGAGGLKVVDDQRGCPTFCDDLSDAILRLLGTGAFGTYHLSGGGSCSRFEFAREILVQAGRPGYPLVPTDHYKRAAQPPAYAPLRNFAAAQLGVDMPHWRNHRKNVQWQGAKASPF